MTYSGNHCLFVQLFAGRIGRYLKHTVTSTLKRPAAAIPPPKVWVKGSKPPCRIRRPRPLTTARAVSIGALKDSFGESSAKGAHTPRSEVRAGEIKRLPSSPGKKSLGFRRRVQGKEVMHVRLYIAICAITGYKFFWENKHYAVFCSCQNIKTQII